MDQDRDRNREEAIVDALLDVEPEQRRAALDEACAADPGLRRLVEELLRLHDRVGDVLRQRDHPQRAAGAAASEVGAHVGDRIGRYKLLQQIGEGGCGVVYLAEQNEPVKRQVALKVIKLGMDTRQVIARFEAERQALALMDHPNIAKVLDAGSTESGRPYFVMELVRGHKITEYCDERRFSTRQRLDLFVQVCRAVQHAHQKGIIHRDLKPSNILVTERDCVPVPKVIDFGIAKATGGLQLTDKTLFTAFEQFVGTPAYMSPEQARLRELDIDTRSDIYSLGVLLYELLTGHSPFDAAELKHLAIDEVLKTIREKDPPLPSNRLTTLTEAERTTVARCRQVEPSLLPKLLRGDLDSIVMKCMGKDRQRRYETANGLAMDITRFLNNEPIVARPPSKLYRFEKLVRRHKFLLGATAAVIVSLLLGVVASTFQAVRAAHAEHRALGEASRAALQTLRAKEAERVASEKTLLAIQERDNAEANLYAADMNLAQRALAENNWDYATDLLMKHKPSTGAKDFRGWEWAYLGHVCHSDELFTLGREIDSVGSLAMSPDGLWLLSASGADGSEGEIKLWDFPSRRPAKILALGEPGTSTAFSPDGEFFAFGTKTCVKVWATGTQREINAIPVKQSPRGGCGLAISPIGHLIAIGEMTGRITLWESEGKTPYSVLNGHTYGIPSLAFHPNGRILASASWDHSVKLWDTVTGREIGDFNKNNCWYQAVAFSPDGHLIAAGDWRGKVHVWQLEDRQQIAFLTNHAMWVASVAFSPDGRSLMSASADYSIRLWNTTNWQEIVTLKGHRDEVSAATFAPNGQMLISGDKAGWIKSWPAAPIPRPPICVSMPTDWALDRAAMALDASAIVLLHTNRSLSLWDGPQLRKRVHHPVPTFETRLADFDISPGGKLIALAANDGEVRMYDSASEELFRLTTGVQTELCLAFSSNAKLLFVGGRNQLTLWDARTGALVSRLSRVENSTMNRVVFSPDAESLAVGTASGSLEIWNIPNATHMEWKAHQRPFDVAFIPGGNLLVTAGRDGNLKLWDSSLPRLIKRLGRAPNAFCSVAVTPDGTRIAAGTSAGEIKLYDKDTGNELTTLLGHTDMVAGLAFTPDTRALVSVGRDGLRVWRAPALTEVETEIAGSSKP